MSYIIALLFFFSFYLPIPFPLFGGWYIPNFPALLLTIFCARQGWFGYRGGWFAIIAVAIYLVFNVSLCYTLVTPFVERAKSALQQLYFVTLAVAIGNSRLLSQRSNRAQIGWSLLVAGAVLLSFGLLERFTGIGAVSDKFRVMMYDGPGLYTNDARDMALVGGIRPKAFAKEPSHAAMGCCICLTMAAVLVNRRAVYWVGAGLVLASLLVFGSPIPLAFLATLVVAGITAALVARRGYTILNLAVSLGVAATIGIVVLAALIYAVEPLRNRFISAVLEDGDRSSYLRIVHVFTLAKESILMNPIFGVGYGGEAELGAQLWLKGREAGSSSSQINNPVWSIGLFGGISAVVFAIAGATVVLRSLPWYSRVVFGLLILSIMLSGGSIVNTVAWIVGGMLFALTKQLTPHMAPIHRFPMQGKFVEEGNARAGGGGAS